MGFIEIADVIINIASIGLVVVIFYNWAVNYNALPDRIPIHFGITGKPDWWVKKTLLSAYFMPTLTAFMWSLMFVAFHLAAGEDGADTPPEFKLMGSALALSLTLMFFRLSTGMIHVASGKAPGIFKYLLPPFILAMAFAAGGAFYSASVGKRPAEFKEIAVCSALGARNAPLNISDTFPVSTKEIHVVAKWKYLNGDRKITCAWIAPDGAERHGGLYMLHANKKMKFARRVSFSLDLEAMAKMGVDVRGKWTVKISLDGKEQVARSFNVYGDDSGFHK